MLALPKHDLGLPMDSADSVLKGRELRFQSVSTGFVVVGDGRNFATRVRWHFRARGRRKMLSELHK